MHQIYSNNRIFDDECRVFDKLRLEVNANDDLIE